MARSILREFGEVLGVRASRFFSERRLLLESLGGVPRIVSSIDNCRRSASSTLRTRLLSTRDMSRVENVGRPWSSSIRGGNLLDSFDAR